MSEHRSIINLTGHPATDEQRVGGVYDPPTRELAAVRRLLGTFNEVMPSRAAINAVAVDLAQIAQDSGRVAALIYGPPYLLSALERELHAREIQPLYSLVRRYEVERWDGDQVRLGTVYRHVGFVLG